MAAILTNTEKLDFYKNNLEDAIACLTLAEQGATNTATNSTGNDTDIDALLNCARTIRLAVNTLNSLSENISDIYCYNKISNEGYKLLQATKSIGTHAVNMLNMYAEAIKEDLIKEQNNIEAEHDHTWNSIKKRYPIFTDETSIQYRYYQHIWNTGNNHPELFPGIIDFKNIRNTVEAITTETLRVHPINQEHQDAA